jgi:hypothetical protein
MISTKPLLTNDLETTNERESFLAYEGSSDKNILFLASCRATPIMYYLHNLFPEYNLYAIYTPYWRSLWDKTGHCYFPYDRINTIVANTDLIITETIRSYSCLNTEKNVSNNFFDTFNTDHLTEIRMSNFELGIYAHDIIHIYKELPNNILNIFAHSRQRLKSSLVKYNYQYIDNFITDNFTTIKLFATQNHPCRILSMLMFKSIASYFNIIPNFTFWQNMSQHNFLEHHSTPITKLDMDLYKFLFIAKIFETDILADSSYKYAPSLEEMTVSNSLIEQYLL